MQTILIEGLSLDAIIGVLPWERHVPQRLVIDLQARLPNKIQEDDVRHTIDYSKLAEGIIAFIGNLEVHLLEVLASRVADYLEKEFAITQLCLTIHKPGALKQARSVGIQETRNWSPL